MANITELQTVSVPSLSTPGKTYLMGWLPLHGWTHIDGNCPAHVDKCRHQRKAEEMTQSLAVIDHMTGELVEQRPLMVAYDTAALAKGVAPDVAAKWAYDLGSQGRGVGIEGAQEAQRMLASYGEVIELDSVDLVSEDDRTSMWVAKATRWQLNPEDPTKRAKTGNHIAWKSQSKWENHSDSWMREHPGQEREYFNVHWAAIGSAKASRNVILDLAPANVRTAIREAGLAAQRALKAANRRNQDEAPPRRVQAIPRPPVAPQDTLPQEPEGLSEEQLATVKGLIASLVDAGIGFAEIKRGAAENWPYAVGDGGFSYGKLRAADVPAFIELLGGYLPLDN